MKTPEDTMDEPYDLPVSAEERTIRETRQTKRLRTLAGSAPSAPGAPAASPGPDRPANDDGNDGDDGDDGNGPVGETEDAAIDEAGKESFPASDPPNWTLGHSTGRKL